MSIQGKFIKPTPMSGYSATTITVNSGTTIQIISIMDNPTNKTVTAYLVGKPYKIVLWEGTAYDNIGQWTDINVKDRIIQLFN